MVLEHCLGAISYRIYVFWVWGYEMGGSEILLKLGVPSMIFVFFQGFEAIHDFKLTFKKLEVPNSIK